VFQIVKNEMLLGLIPFEIFHYDVIIFSLYIFLHGLHMQQDQQETEKDAESLDFLEKEIH